MAVTISLESALIAIRAATDPDAIPGPVLTVGQIMFPAATMCVTEYAPTAPDDIHNAAVVRLMGWLYDAEPTDPQISNSMRVSGAAALLGGYRVHRVGVVGTVPGEAPAPAPPIPAGSIPAPPAAGHYILTSNDGALAWTEFPSP